MAILLCFVILASATTQGTDPKAVSVRHPNLLLNRAEIDEINVKVKEQPWAARLLDRVKVKAEKDEATLEAALAYVLTDDPKYAISVRKRLAREARDQMPHYEKIDVTAEPEWCRWTWWGALAWAYDLAYRAPESYASIITEPSASFQTTEFGNGEWQAELDQPRESKRIQSRDGAEGESGGQIEFLAFGVGDVE
jgi:hypothetical protein